jgi:EAL and modified HD-GYP domain-containing signal transduction protein
MSNSEESRQIFVARQPIFDDTNHVHGYELLYRGSAAAQTADAGDDPPVAEAMAPGLVVDVLLGMGLADLTGGRPAYVNVTRPMIVEGAVELFDREQVVVEVLEDVRPDEETIPALERLASRGYRIALDDFVMDPEAEPFLLLASVVKVDLLQYTPDELETLVERIQPYGARLLAEKVEDEAAHQRALDLGFHYFQGYHFSRPQTLARRDLTIEQLNVMRLLNLVNDPDTSDHEVEEIFRGDVSLSYKLLRMVNSAAMGGRGISSIGHGLRLLGRHYLYRWLALMLASGGASHGPRGEMTQSALLRAGMCERIARAAGHTGAAPALYMTGLFSRLDAILGAPMTDLLDRLDLRSEVYEALTARHGPLAPVLTLVEAYEGGHWLEVPALLKDAQATRLDLREIYLDALFEADRHIQALRLDPIESSG